MTVGKRLWLAVSLLGAVLVTSSCAKQREEEVRKVVDTYLRWEVAQDYRHQSSVYDYQSTIKTPVMRTDLPNPYEPRRLASYTIKSLKIEGATATAQAEAVFTITYPGGTYSVQEKPRPMTIRLLHEQDGWKVDDTNTRLPLLEAMSGRGAGQRWLNQRARLMSGQSLAPDQ